MHTAIGSTLVYPRHGAVTVTGITTRDLDGITVQVLQLQAHSTDLRIQVPLPNLDLVGIREVAAGDRLTEVYKTLTLDFTEEPSNWSRRFKANEEKLGTGDIIRTAEVVRDLWRRSQEKPLSLGEKSTYERARKLLVSELALSADADSTIEAEALLDRVLGGQAVVKA